MVYAIQARVRFTTLNRRNQFITRITNLIAARATWSDATVTRHPTDPEAFIDVRFSARAEQVSAWTATLQDAQTNAVSWTLSRHDCSHDEQNTDLCTLELVASA